MKAFSPGYSRYSLVWFFLVFGGFAAGFNGCGTDEGIFEDLEGSTVLFYKFDEASGSTAVDSSGNGRHGTIVGATRGPGKVGTALLFGATNAHVESIYPNPENFGADEISIEAWVRLTSLDMAAIHQIMGDRWVCCGDIRFQITNGKLEFLLNVAGVWQSIITSTQTFIPGNWTYIAVTYNGSDAKIYFNGVEDATSNNISPITNFFDDIGVGALGHNWVNEFPGEIDELRIFNVVRTPAEINDYYQQTQ